MAQHTVKTLGTSVAPPIVRKRRNTADTSDYLEIPVDATNEDGQPVSIAFEGTLKAVQSKRNSIFNFFRNMSNDVMRETFGKIVHPESVMRPVDSNGTHRLWVRLVSES